jgi:parallel beta-helix repeat protein
MSLSTNRTTFTFNHAGQVDEYGASVGNYATVQENFDSRAEENLTDINNIKTTLVSETADDSGAHNVKSAGIAGLLSGAAASIYAMLSALKGYIDTAAANFQLGTLLDGSVTDVKLSDTAGQIKETVTTHLADYVLIDTDVVADINAKLLDAATNKKWVRFIKGIYEVTGSVEFPDNSIVFGRFAEIKRKAGSGVFDTVKNLDAVNGNLNIKITNLIVDGNKDADSLVATNEADRFSGISFTKVSGDSFIERCTVKGTVNAELHGAIWLKECINVSVGKNVVTDNDGSGIVLFDNVNCKINHNIGYLNDGSAITGGGNVDCEYSGNRTYSNGAGGTYTGLNASGTRSRVLGNVSYSNTGSGITVGEALYASDDSEVTGNQCYSNTLDGLTVQNSARVRVGLNLFKGNSRNGAKFTLGAEDCTIQGNTIIDNAVTATPGLYLDTGSRHSIIGNKVNGNGTSGIALGSTATDCIIEGNECIGNGVHTSGNSAGILANTVTGCIIKGNKCYDALGASGTQESGIWMAGGSNNIVEGNILTGNKTYAIRETVSPAYVRRANKIGTDPLNGTFTAAINTATTINNNNASAGSRIKVWATNAAAVAKGVPFVSSLVAGVSFTITLPSTAAGTETYAYEIE